jgi:hypothetical protein
LVPQEGFEPPTPSLRMMWRANTGPATEVIAAGTAIETAFASCGSCHRTEAAAFLNLRAHPVRLNGDDLPLAPRTLPSGSSLRRSPTLSGSIPCSLGGGLHADVFRRILCSFAHSALWVGESGELDPGSFHLRFLCCSVGPPDWTDAGTGQDECRSRRDTAGTPVRAILSKSLILWRARHDSNV